MDLQEAIWANSEDSQDEYMPPIAVLILILEFNSLRLREVLRHNPKRSKAEPGLTAQTSHALHVQRIPRPVGRIAPRLTGSSDRRPSLSQPISSLCPRLVLVAFNVGSSFERAVCHD